jgi:PTH1 family peptidyl-tRNA hydrolase
MFLVVGLGNPGRRYAQTRHNVGFKVIENLQDRWQIRGESAQLGALVGSGLIANTRATLVRPQKFMNRSGHPVVSIAGYYKLGEEDVIVVHDDVDVPFGQVRVKRGGGHGGHNGLRDIIKHLGRDYLRVRVGVGRPPEGWDTADYVLGKWAAPEQGEISHIVDRASNAVEAVLRDGLDSAMNQFNTRPSKAGNQAEKNRAVSRPEEQ